MSSNILVLESINTAQKHLKRFNPNSNMMAALHSIDCEVYRIEQKMKKGQHTFTDVWKKWSSGAFLKHCVAAGNMFNVVKYF